MFALIIFSDPLFKNASPPFPPRLLIILNFSNPPPPIIKTPPCIEHLRAVDNTDTLYLGDQHLQQTVLVFLEFYFFVYISFPMCQSVCVSVCLFAIHFQFLKTHCYDAPTDF